MTEMENVISKKEVNEFISLLKNITIDEAIEALAQYPEFKNVLKETLENNLELKRLIVAMNQQNAQECFLYYQEVLKDISLCLENPSLSYEERLRLIDKEIEVALIVGKKESELREMNRMILEGEK